MSSGPPRSQDVKFTSCLEYHAKYVVDMVATLLIDVYMVHNIRCSATLMHSLNLETPISFQALLEASDVGPKASRATAIKLHG